MIKKSMISCKNYNSDNIWKIKTKPNSLTLFHLNTCSLNGTFDDLEYLIKTTSQRSMLLL